jgi:hypothetical protein
VSTRPHEISLHLSDLGGDAFGEVSHIQRAYGNPFEEVRQCATRPARAHPRFPSIYFHR